MANVEEEFFELGDNVRNVDPPPAYNAVNGNAGGNNAPAANPANNVVEPPNAQVEQQVQRPAAIPLPPPPPAANNQQKAPPQPNQPHSRVRETSRAGAASSPSPRNNNIARVQNK